ncbi:MAG: EAL domain-containing protein [Halieaceae bacterium]|jgi:diguanylate cyclase (GGDEF)-like protein/PAS domain S-box-containing protein|nr:EAL domain-containing protein [Halieaceae bacterium]
MADSNSLNDCEGDRFSALFRQNRAVMLLLDAGTLRICDANETAHRYYGFDAENLLERPLSNLDVTGTAPDLSNTKPVIARHRLASGAERSVEIHSSPIVAEGQHWIALTIHDVTARLENEQDLRLAAQVLAHTREGVIVTDADMRIITVNQAFTDITGYDRAEVIGEIPGILTSGRHDRAFYAAMYADIERDGYWSGEIWNKHKRGELYPEMLSISRITDDAGRVTHYIGVFSDITKLKQSEQRLEKLAHFDALTGLPNRLMLRARMEHAIAMVNREKQGRVGLLFLDLDQFKIVNDSQGHATGDELLCQVANRLKDRVRATDTVARLGGDEFVILAEGIKQSDDLAVVATDIIEHINQPFQLASTEAFIGTSVGIAVYPDDADSAEALLTYADTAMYRAKEKGRNTYAFYTDSITREADRKLQIANQLRRALARDELVLHFQPQIDLNSGAIVGAEALIRWQHPDEGLLTPSAFVSIAEERGLIHEISRWVISRGCQQLGQWQSQGFQLTVALNVSARDFSYDDFTDDIASIIELSDVDPGGLELELTESGIMENADSVLEALNEIRDMGINLSVDDFGTGYSSFSYLKYLPINKLKIDRSFIHDLESDSGDATIVSAVIDVGKNFGLRVVAEGVESAVQEQLLQNLGCDLAQGYHFSRPLPANEFIDLYARSQAGSVA